MKTKKNHQTSELMMRYMLCTISLLLFLGLFFVTSKSVYHQRLVEFSKGCEVWHILLIDFPSTNSQETTATTGISNLLPQVVSNPIQSDLESSLSQDLRKRSQEEEEERSHPQFYFNSCDNGWYCKIYPTFAPPIVTATPFVNAGTIGDHPIRSANRHL